MSGARRTSRRPESTGGPARLRRARRQPAARFLDGCGGGRTSAASAATAAEDEAVKAPNAVPSRTRSRSSWWRPERAAPAHIAGPPLRVVRSAGAGDDGGQRVAPRPQEKDLLRRMSGSAAAPPCAAAAAALNGLEMSEQMVCLSDRWDPLICRPRIERPAGVGLNF